MLTNFGDMLKLLDESSKTPRSENGAMSKSHFQKELDNTPPREIFELFGFINLTCFPLLQNTVF